MDTQRQVESGLNFDFREESNRKNDSKGSPFLGKNFPGYASFPGFFNDFRLQVLRLPSSATRHDT